MPIVQKRIVSSQRLSLPRELRCPSSSSSRPTRGTQLMADKMRLYAGDEDIDLEELERALQEMRVRHNETEAGAQVGGLSTSSWYSQEWEREKEMKGERQTDRQRDRQTDRKTEREERERNCLL